MTNEERDDLLGNAPPEENLAAKYEHLLHAFEEQGRTMRDIAKVLRSFLWEPDNMTAVHCEALADLLSPPEPIAEADAAEKFSRQCAERRITASSPPSGSEPPSA